MNNLTVTMFDELNEVEVTRTIAGQNALVPNTSAALGFEHDVIGTDEQIESNLKAWIKDRANGQHETILTLVGWKWDLN